MRVGCGGFVRVGVVCIARLVNEQNFAVETPRVSSFMSYVAIATSIAIATFFLDAKINPHGC